MKTLVIVALALALASCRTVTAPLDSVATIEREPEVARPRPAFGDPILDKLKVKDGRDGVAISGRIGKRSDLVIYPDVDHTGEEASVSVGLAFGPGESYFVSIGSYWEDFEHRQGQVFRVAYNDVFVGDATVVAGTNATEFSIEIPWSIIGGRRPCSGGLGIVDRSGYGGDYRFSVGGHGLVLLAEDAAAVDHLMEHVRLVGAGRLR